MSVRTTIREIDLTIAISASVSDAGVLDEDEQIVGFQLPAVALTGTSLSFQVSSDEGGTFVALYDAAGDAVAVVPASGTALRTQWVDPRPFLVAQQVKVVSNDTEAAERVIKALVARII